MSEPMSGLSIFAMLLVPALRKPMLAFRHFAQILTGEILKKGLPQGRKTYRGGVARGKSWHVLAADPSRSA
jgi:hypothetical protein